MRVHPRCRFLIRCSLIAILLSGTPLGLSLAVEPGVDIAVPKVTIVNITNTLVFMPNSSVVQQGDYVCWLNTGSGSHTTTSGSPCVANLVWDVPLGPGALFMRQFLESPGNIPYFCRPHCGMGMTGSVRLTTPIAVQAVDNAGILTLNWTGGGPTYQVFRSSAPSFVSSTVMAPTGGDTGTAFSDPSPVSVGSVNFYLVMNK